MLSIRRTAAALLAVGFLASGCADYGDLLFVKDSRLEFTAPEAYEQVELPVVVAWEMADFEVLPRGSEQTPRPDAGYFAVFVDRAPIKPGALLADIGADDPICGADARCPDRAYLEARGVYVTHRPSIKLRDVASLASTEKVQLHQVTVVLLDAEGRRIGEYAWYRQFRLENRQAAL